MEPSRLKELAPRQLREIFRQEAYSGKTTQLAAGCLQANLVVVPREFAYDFLLFCQRNPKPCPVLEVLEPGDPVPARLARQADLRSDLPLYWVYQDGEKVAEVKNIFSLWREDLVSFLFGCSYTFHGALQRAGIEFRGVYPYITNIPCQKAGRLEGTLAVTMRPIRASQVAQAVEITGRFPLAHGAPVHIGDPASLGIEDVSRPDFGREAVHLEAGEVPVFWACGLTSQLAAMRSKIPLMICHAGGCMFITDLKAEEAG